MKFRLLGVALFACSAHAQQYMPTPSGSYYGVVLSDNFRQGVFIVPNGQQMDIRRFEFTAMPQGTGSFQRETNITHCWGESAASSCYGRISYTLNTGPGLANDDYARVDGSVGGGPTIARKSAVRGAPAQWAVWAEQINLGPGAKAAIWISGDNPEIEGRGFDTVPNAIVINDNLHITGAAIQRNAPAGGTAAVIRIYQKDKLMAELREDGVLRVKRIEYLP